VKIEITRSGAIVEIAYSKPPVNALWIHDMGKLTEALGEAARDEDAKVVILHADGRGYCAGIDIKALAAEPGAISRVNRAAFDLFAAIHHCPLPVISAVHGYALGAGAAMAGASDVLIAAEGAQFGLPEIKVGMLGGASHMLRVLPLSKVRSMYFTGEPIDAAEMHRLGAVEAVVPGAELLPAARSFAQRVATNGGTGLRFAKEALNGIEPVGLEKNYRYEQGFTFEISQLAAGQEARKAFAGRRGGDDGK
jgi:enoyl-CoA hydratase